MKVIRYKDLILPVKVDRLGVATFITANIRTICEYLKVKVDRFLHCLEIELNDKWHVKNKAKETEKVDLQILNIILKKLVVYSKEGNKFKNQMIELTNKLTSHILQLVEETEEPIKPSNENQVPLGRVITHYDRKFTKAKVKELQEKLDLQEKVIQQQAEKTDRVYKDHFESLERELKLNSTVTSLKRTLESKELEIKSIREIIESLKEEISTSDKMLEARESEIQEACKVIKSLKDDKKDCEEANKRTKYNYEALERMYALSLNELLHKDKVIAEITKERDFLKSLIKDFMFTLKGS